jgi:hypothetical protein
MTDKTEKEAQVAEEKELSAEEKEQKRIRDRMIHGIDPDAFERFGFTREMLQQMHDTIDARIAAGPSKLDTGDVLLGEGKQLVPIIPGSLEVEYRTLSSAHEGHINKYTSLAQAELVAEVKAAGLSEDAALDGWDPVRGYCSASLACAVASINKSKKMEDPAGAKDPIEGIKKNLVYIHSLKEMAFWMVWINYRWFVSRVRKLLEEGAIKNG